MTDLTPIDTDATASRTEPDSDAALLDAVRSGDLNAYGPLFDRHHPAAVALARRLTRSQAEADDVAADAFDRVMRAIGNGSGPTEAFRAYLLTAVRRTAWRRTEQTDRERGVDDETTFDLLVPPTDDSTDDDDHALAVEAFTELPERWQSILWYTLVEEKKPAEVAPLLGLSPNATAALAVRAREGLREAYLQCHLASAVPESCQFTVDRLGASVRGNLGKRDRAKVDAHLADCDRCQDLENDLGSVNGLMRSVIGPAVLGIGVAEYRSGISTAEAPPTGSSVADGRSISFGRAVAVATVAAVALAALGVQSDILGSASTSATSTPVVAASVDSGVEDIVTAGPQLTPVETGDCVGPELPMDLPEGSTITALQAVVASSNPPSSAGGITSRAVSPSAAASLQPVAVALPAVTTNGLCARSVAGLTDIDLLLATQVADGSIVFRLVDDLVGQTISVLRAAIDAAGAATTVPDPIDGALPASPQVPDVGGGDGPLVLTPPAVPIAPQLPQISPDDLPDAQDLVDDLTETVGL